MGGFHVGLIFIIFIQKRNTRSVDVFDMLVADGYPVRVLPQVIHYLLCVTQWRLAINYPWFAVTLVDCLLVLSKLVAFSEFRLQLLEQFTLESCTQLRYRIQVFTVFGNLFEFPFQGKSGSRHKAMQVWAVSYTHLRAH